MQNWKVKHRYNDFFNLHELLLRNYSNLPKLPQKSMFAFTSEAKIEKRRKDLEKYLTELLELDHIMQNVYAVQFFKLNEYFPEYLCKHPEVLCKYETASNLTFTEVNFVDERIINYVLCSKGIKKSAYHGKIDPVDHKAVQSSESSSHKSLLNGFKFDESEPVNMF